MRTSRRDFVKLLTSSGIAVSVSRLAFAEQPDFVSRETLPGRQAWNPAANGTGRIDGVAKVTGSKLYAADFRAADLPGWPAKTSHAMLIRATDATHICDALDLSRLTGALKPSVVVTAEDLARIGTRVPEFYAGDLLCPIGRTPLYLGQPIAILIFEDFDSFDQARLALRDGNVVRYGEETGPTRGRPTPRFVYPSRRAHAGCSRRLFAGQEWLGQSGKISEHRAADLGAAADSHRARVRGGRGLRRRHSRRACG